MRRRTVGGSGGSLITKTCIAWAVTTTTTAKSVHIHTVTNEYLPSSSIPLHNYAIFLQMSGWSSNSTSFRNGASKDSIA